MVWILFILLTIVIVIAVMWWLAYQILFFPSLDMVWTPDVDYDDIYLESGDNSGRVYSRGWKPLKKSINVWHLSNFPDQKVIVFYHGNNGNISHRDYIVDICQRFHLNLILMDYQGFGRSGGQSSIKSIREDADTVYAFARTKYDPSKIIVWGESLGGAAAIHVAANRDCDCLILMSAFASLEDVIFTAGGPSYYTRPIGSLVQWIIEPIPNRDWIRKVRCSVAIIHSQEDDLISYQNAQILYDSVEHDNKVLISIKGQHSSPQFEPEDLRTLFRFVGVNIGRCDDRNIEEIIDMISSVAERHEKAFKRKSIFA